MSTSYQEVHSYWLPVHPTGRTGHTNAPLLIKTGFSLITKQSSRHFGHDLFTIPGNSIHDFACSGKISDRPGGLTDGPKTGAYKAGVDGKIGAGQVSRADVADFVLKQLTDATYLHQAPAVS